MKLNNLLHRECFSILLFIVMSYYHPTLERLRKSENRGREREYARQREGGINK